MCLAFKHIEIQGSVDILFHFSLFLGLNPQPVQLQPGNQTARPNNYMKIADFNSNIYL